MVVTKDFVLYSEMLFIRHLSIYVVFIFISGMLNIYGDIQILIQNINVLKTLPCYLGVLVYYMFLIFLLICNKDQHSPIYITLKNKNYQPQQK